MRAVLTSQSGLTMFTAVTPTPTYWQVATLGHFNGVAWLPDLATKDAAEDKVATGPIRPPRAPPPPATHTFTVHVAIGDLRSNLLPVPPATVAVADAASVQRRAGHRRRPALRQPRGADLRGHRPRPHRPRTAPRRSVSLDQAPGVAPYLALPTSIPADVVALAHRIVAHAQGPAAAATALVRYFTAGKRFRYTLTPPPTAPGRRPGQLPLHHPGRLLPAVRRRLRRPGPHRRPPHPPGRRLHHRLGRQARHLHRHRLRRPLLAPGLPGPDRRLGLLRTHPGLVRRGPRGRRPERGTDDQAVIVQGPGRHHHHPLGPPPRTERPPAGRL